MQIGAAVQAVSPANDQAIPSGYMYEAEAALLENVRSYSNKPSDIAVSLAQQLCGKYTLTHAELVRTRELVQDAQKAGQGELSLAGDSGAAVKMRDEAYSAHLRSAEALQEACPKHLLASVERLKEAVSIDKICEMQALIDSLPSALGGSEGNSLGE